MKTKLQIEGLKCEGCVKRICNILKQIKGIAEFELTLESKILSVNIKNKKILKEIKEQINSLGFTITEIDENI